MTIKFQRKYLGIWLGFFWGCSVSGNPDPLPKFRFSPLVVTPKSPSSGIKNLQERILKGNEWRLLQSETLSGSLENLSNITVLPSGGTGSFTQISFPGAPSSGTLVMWEDLILNDPASADGVFDFSTLGSDTFDCIEMFQGNDPRFGTSGTGGTIRLSNTFNDKPSKPNKIKVEEGSYGESLLKASHTIFFETGKLKVGISGVRGDGAPLSLNPSYRKRQGFQEGSINLSGKFDLKQSSYISFFLREGENRLEDLYTHLGRFQSNSHLAAVHYLQKSLNGKTEEKFSFLKNFLGRQSFISSDKTSTFKGDRMEGKYSLTHILGPHMVFEGGVGGVRESFYQYSLTQEKTFVSLTKERSFGYIFMSPTWTITPPLSFNLGGRVEGEMEGKPLFAGKSSLDYQKKGRVMSLSFDVAQKRPTLFELYASDSYAIGNPSLKPQQSEGVQIMLLQKQIITNTDLGIRLFERSFKQSIVGVLQNNQWKIYQETSSFRTKGVEPFGTIKLSHAWKVEGELTYTKYPNAASSLPYTLTPSFKASGTVFYVIEHEKPDASELYLKARYVKDRLSSGGQKLAPYTVFDVGGHYNINQSINFYIRFNNIFNTSYLQQMNTSLKSEPLTFHVGVGVQF